MGFGFGLIGDIDTGRFKIGICILGPNRSRSPKGILYHVQLLRNREAITNLEVQGRRLFRLLALRPVPARLQSEQSTFPIISSHQPAPRWLGDRDN